MVATDVAARGLDIPDVEYVINYSFPLTIGKFFPALAAPPSYFCVPSWYRTVAMYKVEAAVLPEASACTSSYFCANVAAHVGSSGVLPPFDALGVRCYRRLCLVALILVPALVMRVIPSLSLDPAPPAFIHVVNASDRDAFYFRTQQVHTCHAPVPPPLFQRTTFTG